MRSIPAFLCRALDLPTDRPWWATTDLNRTHRAHNEQQGFAVYTPPLPALQRWDGLALLSGNTEPAFGARLHLPETTRMTTQTSLRLVYSGSNAQLRAQLHQLTTLLEGVQDVHQAAALLDTACPLPRPAFQMHQIWGIEVGGTLALQCVSLLTFREDQLAAIGFSGGLPFAPTQLSCMPTFLVSPPYWAAPAGAEESARAATP